MGSKEQYQANRARVFEIMGVDPNDPDYNCHHIMFRSDFRENPNWDESYCDSMANLCPMLKELHERVHKRVEEMADEREERVLYQASQPKKPVKYRLHDLGRLWQRT